MAGLAVGMAASASAGRIECDAPMFDFGEKPETEIVTHVFTLRNSGTGPLRIDDIQETCGCIVTDVSDTLIPPGGSLSIEVKLSLRGRRGRQRHHVVVLSSDTRTPRLTLAMTGLVRTEVALRPFQVFLGRVPPVFEETRLIEVSVEGNRPVKVLKVSSEAPWVEGVFELGDNATGAGQIQLRFRPPLPVGLIHTAIRVETDHPRVPVLTLPVGAFVQNPPAQPPEGEP